MLQEIKKLWNNKQVQHWISLISYGVLLYYFFLMVGSAIQTIIWTIKTDKYFDAEIMRQNGHMFNVHARMLITAIMLLFLSIFKKHIKIYMVAIIFIFNDVVNTYHFVEMILPKYLLPLGIFNWLKAEGQQLINPQWINVYLLTLGIMILSIQVFIKKYRSIERIFTWLISLSVILTLIVFHFAIVFGSYKFQRENQVNMLIRQINNEKREDFCENRVCIDIEYTTNAFKTVKKQEKTKDEFAKENQYLQKYPLFQSVILVQKNKGLEKSDTYGYHMQNPENVGFDYYTFAIKKISNDKAIFVLDNKNAKFSEINIVWFSFLAGIAHSIWISLGYLLLFIHKDYFFKKRVEKMKQLQDSKTEEIK